MRPDLIVFYGRGGESEPERLIEGALRAVTLLREALPQAPSSAPRVSATPADGATLVTAAIQSPKRETAPERRLTVGICSASPPTTAMTDSPFLTSVEPPARIHVPDAFILWPIGKPHSTPVATCETPEESLFLNV